MFSEFMGAIHPKTVAHVTLDPKAKAEDKKASISEKRSADNNVRVLRNRWQLSLLLSIGT